MPRVHATLDPEETKALIRLARRERRDLRQQAALIIRQELERLGLLPKEDDPAPVMNLKQEAVND
jgi:hypothetical protein